MTAMSTYAYWRTGGDTTDKADNRWMLAVRMTTHQGVRCREVGGEVYREGRGGVEVVVVRRTMWRGHSDEKDITVKDAVVRWPIRGTMRW